jgi:hypothetical protein
LWLALTWRDPRAGLLVAAGPLLAPLGALAAAPLAAQLARGHARRAAQAAAAILLGAVVAGVRGVSLPFETSPAPDLGLAGSERPLAVARSLWDALLAHPVLLAETAVAAAAAVLLGFARGRGPWPAALFGGGLLAATALAAPAAPALPLVLVAWATAAALALERAN